MNKTKVTWKANNELCAYVFEVFEEHADEKLHLMKGKNKMNSKELISELERQVDAGFYDFDELPEIEGKDDETARNDLLESLKETQRRLWLYLAFLYCHTDVSEQLVGIVSQEIDLDKLLKDGAKFGIEFERLNALKNFDHNEIIFST